ncbi:25196_t:CDS:2 [Cetraspora pellucida]|uniref:25196_t:CDS:1 n=1 Tax=Cetraspora pellucida TaxID=1433469 RepID=A0A9N9HBS3_9GLOM|nr:25196_t:CDS:2 [Cetraspora pellucida]
MRTFEINQRIKIDEKNDIEMPYVYIKEGYIPFSFRWWHSAARKVLGHALIVTAFSAVVTTISLKTKYKLDIPLTFINILSFVVGLLLAYRINAAHNRHLNNGRLKAKNKDRSNTEEEIKEIKEEEIREEIKEEIREEIKEEIREDIKEEIREEIKEEEEEEKIMIEEEEKEIFREKRCAVRLLIGFAIATKHYLREERGEECKPFISNINSTLPGFKALMVLDDKSESENIDQEESECLRFKTLFRRNLSLYVHHNLPLEISLYISDYITTQFQEERINVPIAIHMLTNLNLLIECLSAFERISRTPVHFAVAIHIAQTVWFYCLSLPFQLVSILGWLTIVVVFFAAETPSWETTTQIL